MGSLQQDLHNWFVDCDFTIPPSLVEQIFKEQERVKRQSSDASISQATWLNASTSSLPAKRTSKAPLTPIKSPIPVEERTTPPKVHKSRIPPASKCHSCKRKVRKSQALQCESCGRSYCQYCVPLGFFDKCVVCRGECTCCDCVKEAFLTDVAQISGKRSRAS
jgi:hypothetical protein